MFLFIFIGLLGAMALSAGETLPVALPRKTVTMGDAEDDKKTQQKSSARLERFVVETMRLSDAAEVARRARRLSTEYPQTAKVVMRRARELEHSKNAAKAPIEVYQAAKVREPQSVFNLKWTKFLYSVVRDVSDVTNGHVGYFFFSWTRLVALKLATNLRKEDIQGRKVWKADIVPPPTLDEFLASSKLQYEAFVKSILDYLPQLMAPRFAVFIGKDLEGKRITLSGLLAVAHAAGIDGLKSWLANPNDRTKYPNTTAAFTKSTEIF